MLDSEARTRGRAVSLHSRIIARPVSSFFLIAFSISWAIWIAAPLVDGGNEAVFSMLTLLGASGPALSAIFVASVLNPAPSGASGRKRSIAFLLVFVATYALQILLSLFLTRSFGVVLLFTSVATSAVAAYIMSSVYHSVQGVVTLLAGLGRASVKSRWVLVGALVPLAWQLLGGAVDLGLGGAGLPSLNVWIVPSMLAAYPLTFFFGGPLTEEPGWRGFATPMLQERNSLLKTGLIIGIIWSTWHFPLYFNGLYPGGLTAALVRFAYNVPLGIFFVFFYDMSGGNLLAVMLLHASFNTTASMFGPVAELIALVLMAISTVALVIYERRHRKPGNPLEHRVVGPVSSERPSSA